MQCEICGRVFKEGGYKIRVEGSVVAACEGCSGSGEILGPAVEVKKKQYLPEQKPVGLDIDTGMEIADDYASLIHNARQKKGMKQEELAKAINEPVSTIHRLESGHFEPSIAMAKKIGRALNVWLFEKAAAEDGGTCTGAKIGKPHEPKELTLGDMVRIKKK